MKKNKVIIIISLSLVLLLILTLFIIVTKNNLTGRAIQRDFSQESKSTFKKVTEKLGFRRGTPISEDVFQLQGDLQRETFIFEFDNSYYSEDVIDETLEKLNIALIDHLDEIYYGRTNRHIQDTTDYPDESNSYEKLDYSLGLLEGTLTTQNYEELSEEISFYISIFAEFFSAPIEILEFSDDLKQKQLTGFGISGNFKFENSDSLIRVILIDSNQKEYQIFEAYPLLDYELGKIYTISDYCDETCVLEDVHVQDLRVEIYNPGGVEFKLDSVSFLESENNQDPDELLDLREKSKVRRLNKMIEQIGLGWTAGSNGFSKNSYENKKIINFEWANSQGFEYYSRGVFEIWSEETESEIPLDENRGPIENERPNLLERIFLGRVISNTNFNSEPAPQEIQTEETCDAEDSNGRCLPDSWDWREYQGGNNPNSFYYDKYPSFVRHQGNCGSCYAFATIGALESNFNLYYNIPFELELSQQSLICMYKDLISPTFQENPEGYSGGCRGGWLDLFFEEVNYFYKSSLNPYHASDSENFCRNIENGDYYKFNRNLVDTYRLSPDVKSPELTRLKSDLLQKGPLFFGYYGMWTFNLEPNKKKQIQESIKVMIREKGIVSLNLLRQAFPSVIRGHLGHAVNLEGYYYGDVFIFKNSWGTAWGNNGYFYESLNSGEGYFYSEDVLVMNKYQPSYGLDGALSGLFNREFKGYVINPLDGHLVKSNGDEITDIKCYDMDGDGFCNWGLTGFPLKEDSWESENPMPESCEQASYGISPDGEPGVYDTEWGCVNLNPNIPDADDSNPLIGHYENDSYSGSVSDCLIHADCEDGGRCVWNEDLKIRQCTVKCRDCGDCSWGGTQYYNRQGKFCQPYCLGESCTAHCYWPGFGSGTCENLIGDTVLFHAQTCKMGLVVDENGYDVCTYINCDKYPPAGAYIEVDYIEE